MRLLVDTSDLVKLEKGLKELSAERMVRVLYRSNNATGGTGKTIIKNTLSKETSLPARHVLSKIKIHKGHANKPTYHMMLKDRHVRLIEFQGRQLRKMVTSAKVWGKRQRFKGTFIATMSNGRQGIFKHGKGRTKNGNQKIEMLYGPSLPKELIRGSSEAVLRKHIREKFPINVKRFTSHEIGQVKAKHGL